jgi:hypothetical protein
MESFNIEQVRETVNFIQNAVEAIDALTNRMNEVRWRGETVKRDPSLGVVQNPNTGDLRSFESGEFFRSYEKLATERRVNIEVLLDLTGADTLDEVRQMYMTLASAYQRVGALRELIVLCGADVPAAMEEAAKQNLLSHEERQTALDNALVKLEALAALVVIRPPSNLSIVKSVPTA